MEGFSSKKLQLDKWFAGAVTCERGCVVGGLGVGCGMGCLVSRQ